VKDESRRHAVPSSACYPKAPAAWSPFTRSPPPFKNLMAAVWPVLGREGGDGCIQTTCGPVFRMLPELVILHPLPSSSGILSALQRLWPSVREGRGRRMNPGGMRSRLPHVTRRRPLPGHPSPSPLPVLVVRPSSIDWCCRTDCQSVLRVALPATRPMKLDNPLVSPSVTIPSPVGRAGVKDESRRHAVPSSACYPKAPATGSSFALSLPNWQPVLRPGLSAAPPSGSCR